MQNLGPVKMLENEIYFKFKEAELEAKTTDERYSHEEVFSYLKSRLEKKVNDDS